MLNLKATLPERLFAALQAAGMPEVPGEFSVVPRHQVLPSAVLAEIAGFIRVFDQVTTHEAWQAAARREAPAIARLRRPEVCFFSAWDFHLPPEGGWQLIEFNDNGSGFLFAAIINALDHEARAFFEECPADLFLILDDAESLQHGKFRGELRLLCDLLRRQGWRAEVGCPAQTRWDGRQLLFEGQAVSFIVNRSTDFLWQSEDFSALRRAYEAGRVY